MVYVHGILQHKQMKSFGVKLRFLRASTDRISHGCVFWELPRPLSGITDGGSGETLDNHPPRQKKKKKWRNRDWNEETKIINIHWQHTDNKVAGYVVDLFTPLAWYSFLRRRKSPFPSHDPDIVICSVGPLRENLIYLSLAPMSWILYSRREQNPQINTLIPSLWELALLTLKQQNVKDMCSVPRSYLIEITLNIMKIRSSFFFIISNNMCPYLVLTFSWYCLREESSDWIRAVAWPTNMA